MSASGPSGPLVFIHLPSLTGVSCTIRITMYVYSAPMKSYQYRNFDISENTYYNSLASVTFMFLVNDKLVWRDKTVTRALELWCT